MTTTTLPCEDQRAGLTPDEIDDILARVIRFYGIAWEELMRMPWGVLDMLSRKSDKLRAAERTERIVDTHSKDPDDLLQRLRWQAAGTVSYGKPASIKELEKKRLAHEARRERLRAQKR